MAEDTSTTPTPLAEIDHGPSKFEQFLENNLKKIILGILLVILGVAAFIVVTGLKETEDHSAGEALLAASDIAGLREVMDTYPSTPASGSAAILLAEQQWNDGRKEDAISTLTTFINANPEHPGRGTATLALATHLLEQGKTDEAKTQFQSVADDMNAKHLAPFALLTLGDLEKKAGNEDAARSFYERALNDFPANSPSINGVANERLSLLGVEPPVKIAAPEPETTTPEVDMPGTPSLNPTNPLFPPSFTPGNTEGSAPATIIPPAATAPAEAEETPAPPAETAPAEVEESTPAPSAEAPENSPGEE